MDNFSKGPAHTYHIEEFIGGRDAQVLQILSDYLEPNNPFQYHHIDDTIVFMDSERILAQEEAEAHLAWTAIASLMSGSEFSRRY